MRASLACRLPQCRCSSPALLRTNTSHRGQSAESMMSADALIAAESMTSADPAAVGGGGSWCLPLGWCRGMFGGMGQGGCAHPGSVVPGLDARAQALLVAGAIA